MNREERKEFTAFNRMVGNVIRKGALISVEGVSLKSTYMNKYYGPKEGGSEEDETTGAETVETVSEESVDENEGSGDLVD